MQKLWQELRFDARRLMKQAGVLPLALLTLALGAGFTGMRGFVGVAFRVSPDTAKDAPKYECFYLRPTNE